MPLKFNVTFFFNENLLKCMRNYTIRLYKIKDMVLILALEDPVSNKTIVIN